MPIQHIENLESATSVRGKLNEVIDEVNHVTEVVSVPAPDFIPDGYALVAESGNWVTKPVAPIHIDCGVF